MSRPAGDADKRLIRAAREMMPKTGIADASGAYVALMKYGLSRNYWNDYLMDAYVNHRHDMIMLAGIPDLPASLPHARGNNP